jgi:hypothetical protein
MEGTVVSEDESSPSGPLSESTGGLKDTFWKDLEEGRVNLFDTDMYSRVKGGGRGPRSEKKNKSSDGSSVRRVNTTVPSIKACKYKMENTCTWIVEIKYN